MSVSAALPSPASPRNSRRLRVHAKADDVSRLDLKIEEGEIAWSDTDVVVEVAAAAVNPSDVKATLGMMPHAHWPRTPGRDFAGTIVEGPSHLIGMDVWGSSGELGICRDGSHGTHLLLSAADVREKPHAMSMLEAGAIGVPFVTAWKGFERSGFPKPGDNVVVLGATGKVGQAAIQIASMLGARTIGVMRDGSTYDGHHAGPVDIVVGNGPKAIAEIRVRTEGRGVDIAFNTVGSPYFEVANRAMAIRGRQIFISTIERSVPFDIFAFYRARHKFVGIDTLALDSGECAAILDELKPGFESGSLKPFPVRDDRVYPLARAAEAYNAVLAGSHERIVLDPRA